MPASPHRVALVTGAGRGLGAEIARTLANDHIVAVNDLPGSPQAEAVAESIRARGGQAAAFGADITDEAAVVDLVARVTAELGPVDVLVPCATGPQPAIELERLAWADLLDPLLFFVKSPALLVRAVLPAMRRRGRGRVVLIGSDLAERVEPGWSAYSAAKAAQQALARTWAVELGPSGVTVNVVAPGWIPVERHAGTPPDVLQAYTAHVPLGRTGTPADVAAAVVYLASDAAAFVTGARLAVNGGHTFL